VFGVARLEPCEFEFEQWPAEPADMGPEQLLRKGIQFAVELADFFDGFDDISGEFVPTRALFGDVLRDVKGVFPAELARDQKQGFIEALRKANKGKVILQVVFREIEPFARTSAVRHAAAAAGNHAHLAVVQFRAEFAEDVLFQRHLSRSHGLMEVMVGLAQDVAVMGDHALDGVAQDGDVFERLGEVFVNAVVEMAGDELKQLAFGRGQRFQSLEVRGRITKDKGAFGLEARFEDRTEGASRSLGDVEKNECRSGMAAIIPDALGPLTGGIR